MIGVIYARYSSDNQREESIDGQLRECRAFAEKNDITLLEPYIDRALSAKTDNRPNFQKMIKDSASKKIDVVIVWKLDRFARNRYDSAHYKSVLRKNGVRVMSARPNPFPRVQRAFCWNPCWKVWRNIIRQSFPKRLYAI